MPQTTNPYFNNFFQGDEQSLLEDLIIESIQIYGLEVLYIPREYMALDLLLGEDPLSAFRRAYPIEMYVKSVEFYEGDGDFMSKFGLEVRNELSFNCSIKRFDELVTQKFKLDTGTDIIRPREGDLIYFTIDKRLFEIMNNEKRSVFFQLGNLYMYDLKCKEFELGAEKFATGINDVDDIEDRYDYAVDLTLTSGTGEFIIGEKVDGSNGFTAQVSAWDDATKVLKIIRPSGVLPTTGSIIGELSSAAWSISTVAPVQNVNETITDNDRVNNPTVVLPPAQPNPLLSGI